MLGYITVRLLAAIPVLLIVGVLTFSLLHVAPGDPAAIIGGTDATPDDIEEIRKQLGLDKPFFVQLALFFKRLLQGDLGTSIFSGHSVGGLIAPRVVPSLSLAIYTLIIALVMGISLGVVAAWKQNTWIDRVVMIFAVLGFSIPAFWLGFNLIWVFALKLSWFPVLGYSPISDGFFQFLWHLTLPAIATAAFSAALIARMTRSSMLDVLREDYVRTARAKGLSERVVLIRHALKPASIPVVTVIGLVFATMITGLVVTESVFAIPGMGRMVVDAVVRRDFPIVQGVIMVLAGSYVFVNLVVDITYAYLDPRIRY